MGRGLPLTGFFFGVFGDKTTFRFITPLRADGRA